MSNGEMSIQIVTSWLNDLIGSIFRETKEKKSWKGCPCYQLNANLDILPPQPRSNHHTIFVNWPPIENKAHFVPFPAKYQEPCTERYVDMPFAEKSMCPVRVKRKKNKDKSGTMTLTPRWPLIETALTKPMKSSHDIQAQILKYNQQSQLNFSGLHQFLKTGLDPKSEEYTAFFDQVLPEIAKLCLELPNLVTQPIPLLERYWVYSLTFSQRQIASLLANAFFCTFPKRDSVKSKFSNYPSINFNRLFSDLDDKHGVQGEKLKCLINYFRMISAKKPEEETLVSFQRYFIPHQFLPKWEESRAKLTRLHINAEGTIEDDGFGMLQVDFANAFVGGGVLSQGCVQEEIRFLISPELILSRLFTERLNDNECLVVTGFERFSKYTGYSRSFKYDGAYKDETPIHEGSKHRKTQMVAIDALPGRYSSNQYSPYNVKRELNKAFVGFKNYDSTIREPVAVATGNWGCGAFGGDPQLKSLIQIMAASEARRDVAYFTFSNRQLRDQIHEMHELLQSRKLAVGEVFQIVCNYHLFRSGKSTLFEFMQNQLRYPDIGTPKKAVSTNAINMNSKAAFRCDVIDKNSKAGSSFQTVNTTNATNSQTYADVLSGKSTSKRQETKSQEPESLHQKDRIHQHAIQNEYKWPSQEKMEGKWMELHQKDQETKLEVCQQEAFMREKEKPHPDEKLSKGESNLEEFEKRQNEGQSRSNGYEQKPRQQKGRGKKQRKNGFSKKKK